MVVPSWGSSSTSCRATARSSPPSGRTPQELESLGPRVEAARRNEPTRRALTLIDPTGERTITTLGKRLQPNAADPLPWAELGSVDTAYFSAGDLGALAAARRARVLVATSRVLDVLAQADFALDAVVGSGRDPAERYRPSALKRPPRLAVLTDGARGGVWRTADGRSGGFSAAPPPGPIVDTYGGGDSFVAGLTYALGVGMQIEPALELAARCGAACVAGRGPYSGQLTRADL